MRDGAMLFSSWQFILLFLPVSVAVYFALNLRGWIGTGKLWLVLASLFFYAYWDPRQLPLILISIGFNYAVGQTLARGWLWSESPGRRKALLAFGIVMNLLVLAWFKYADFVIGNLNGALGSDLPELHIALPLAISFFTFTQIVYLVDSWRRETGQYNLLNYALFVTFFPHLIAGPIVQHSQIMPQFSDRRTLSPRAAAMLLGLVIFGIGLFKKAVIADSLAVWADAGFDTPIALTFWQAWVTSLSYTLQLYYDFSGYCDMAVGASLLFNIRLPINFNSPYQARDIQDFWRRWHITLSSFLRDYLYIPLGGNRRGRLRTQINLFVTFVLGGLWHGASWMFVIWGALHGAALILHRMWRGAGFRMPGWAGWALTFLFVNVTWVFFRAKSLEDARRVLTGMVDLETAFGAGAHRDLVANLGWVGVGGDALLHLIPATLIGQLPILMFIAAATGLLFARNLNHLEERHLTTARLVYAGVLLSVGLQATLAQTTSVFLYFNF
jgi:D-alanyl-lipoteichoic acid acyltransferase DltB (MBOAT superfamily)